jgi:hypothetical protein
MEIPQKFYEKYDSLSKEEIKVYLVLCQEVLYPEDLQQQEYVITRTKKNLMEATGMTAGEIKVSLTNLQKQGMVKLPRRKIVLIVRKSSSKSCK